MKMEPVEGASMKLRWVKHGEYYHLTLNGHVTRAVIKQWYEHKFVKDRRVYGIWNYVAYFRGTRRGDHTSLKAAQAALVKLIADMFVVWMNNEQSLNSPKAKEVMSK